jgi:hypothetical protein
MATQKNLCIEQASTFVLVMTVVGGPESLTDYEGEMQIRRSKSDTTTLVDVPTANFTVNDGTKQVILEIPSDETELYDWSGFAVYDAYVVGPTNDRWRLIQGTARLSKTVTRED